MRENICNGCCASPHATLSLFCLGQSIRKWQASGWLTTSRVKKTLPLTVYRWTNLLLISQLRRSLLSQTCCVAASELFYFPFQLGLFGESSWRRERCFHSSNCFSRNGHCEVDVTSQRPGSQTEEICALPFPCTSSSIAHEDELSCHPLAAGEGFGRPARYLLALHH